MANKRNQDGHAEHNVAQLFQELSQSTLSPPSMTFSERELNISLFTNKNTSTNDKIL